MIHKSWILSLQPSIPTRCSCESVQQRLPAAVRTNRLPASSELTHWSLSTHLSLIAENFTHENCNCLQAVPLAGIVGYHFRLSMQSLHSVSCTGAHTAAALITPRLQCYRRMCAGATAPTTISFRAKLSFRAKSRPVRVVAAAGSLETATQPSADTAHLGRVLKSCCDLRMPEPSRAPCSSYILPPFV